MKTKGTNWIAMKDYLHKTFTAEQLKTLNEALDDESKRLFNDRTILQVSWVDYSVYMKILIVADRILGNGDLELLRKANYYCARRDISGVYRFLVSLVSPKTVINALGKLLARYYDRGTLTVEDLKSNSATIIIEDAPDIPLYHDAEMAAYVGETLRMAGAKNPKFAHIECMALGDPRCRFKVTWD